MIILDAIHQSNSDVQIYELLTCYIDTVPLAQNPAGAMLRPIENQVGVMKQMQALFTVLGLVSRRLDDPSRVAIKEALYVLHAALDRLRSLSEAGVERRCAREARAARIEDSCSLGHERRWDGRDSRCLQA